jgi:hypothetical protein
MCTRNKIDPTGWSTSPPLSTTPSTTAPPGCDADALKERGMEHINMGQHAAALAQFEASLRCKDDPYVVSLAFMSACSAKSETKARQYWAKLSDEQQTRYRQMCVRNGIDPASSGPAPAKCDADALKDKGMELINMGQHSAALREFEASLACKNDSYVVMLAFMAACNAHDETKARAHYKRLSTTEQERYRQLCVRNHIDPEAHSDSGTDADDVDGAAANKDAFEGLAAGKGYLQVTSTRKATIMIDGKDTGLTTPITGTQLPLTAGKHKVTYVIGGERFTYPVLIKAGQTEEMTKDIR